MQKRIVALHIPIFEQILAKAYLIVLFTIKENKF